MEVLLSFLWSCLYLFCAANAIPQTLLYDYAVSDGLQLPKGDEVSSPEIKLTKPIVFYGRPFDTIYVNSNGLLSFQAELPDFLNTEFPLPDPVIAPFYSNVDTTQAGTIWYYQTEDAKLLQRATDTIHDSFSTAFEFQALNLFIATWEGVGYQGGSDRVNTYQVVISTDGVDSYVEFIYPEGGLQWIRGDGNKESGLPDARAQVGFVAPDGRYYTLPNSGTDQVRNLDKLTNMNVPGQWLFRIGLIDLDIPIEEPDTNNDAGLLTGPPSCSKASIYCHSDATCNDYSGGVCCQCNPGFYGNGQSCIKNDVPLRVNGKVRGKLNGEKLDDLDLQSYVILTGAKAYTAVSNVPESIGFSSQTLQILGAVIGWLFAEPVREGINGYQLSGGYVNHSATVYFTNTSQKFTLRQKFSGLDVFDQLRMEADIQGEIPTLPFNSKIIIQEYQEQYTLTAPGVIQSSSSHYFTYTDSSNNQVVQLYRVDQNFVFDYCKFESTPVGTTWRLRVGKNFIAYDSTERIIRFGMNNKVGPLGDYDPCEEGRKTCGANSACIVEEDSYRCVCNPGFQYLYRENERVCSDIDECQSRLHDCDINAECLNEIGTYHCRCNPGYNGDGRTCRSSQTCQNTQCNENAQCAEDPAARCICLEGFTGDGERCSPIVSQGCNVANNCSPYGICSINPNTQEYYCSCLPNYEGDGYTCTPAAVTQAPGDRVEKQCLLGVCWCPTGYEADNDTNYCEPVTQAQTTEYPGYQTYDTTETDVSCNVLNNCHRDAQCTFIPDTNSYQCVCNVNYVGDGYECSPDLHSTCSYDETLGRTVCACKPGYEGTGYDCKPLLPTAAICTSNADCTETEECLYTSISRQQECICKEGYVRDSQNQCVQLTGTCGGGTCVKNAECLYDEEYQTYYCSCKSDYVGDGITECVQRPIGCNIVNNCGLHASCLYDTKLSSYQCKCEEGFHGDGFVCSKEKNCHTDPIICDPNASCLPKANRKYACECNFGYTGNGTICKQNPRHEGNFLLLNQGMGTIKIPFEPTRDNPGKFIYNKVYQMAVGLDIDCLTGKVYWSDINGKVIRRAFYNGSDVEDFITHDVGTPEGLTIDWVSRNIYWTDSTKDTIEVANIETKLRKVLFNTKLVNPRGIAVHPQRGKIFWADWNRKDPKIEWANADGTNRQIFLQGETVKLPNSLVVDFDTEQLCYADAGTKSIECVDIDSRSRRTMATNCTYPFGIAVSDINVYWTDWITKKIERVDKRTSARLPALQIPHGLSINKLYELAAVPEHCPPVTNVCQFYKDQCPSGHICLPNGSGSRSCICGYKSESPLEKPICNY